MARAAIVREMSGVFGVYNIEVDIRHLELIADYMVGAGAINPTISS
jgi:DNA-directed RNA polymerase I subunit RPA1